MRLINGDCLEVMRGGVENESIDLIVTDPPYLIKYKTGHRKNKQHEFCSQIQNDDNQNLISEFLKEAYRVLKDDSAMYVFASWKKIDFFRKCAKENNFTIKNEIIWVKNNWTAGDLKGQFGQQYETIMLLNKGRCFLKGKRYPDVWNFKRVSGKAQVHQNQKPVDLIERCIESHSKEGDIILDPFMGSGTTGVACKNLNRNFIGIELDEKYFNIARNRIESA